MELNTTEYGNPNSPSYRVLIHSGEKPVSIIHDVPLYADKENFVYNMIVLSPRMSNTKMKISLDEPLCPIMHQEYYGKIVYLPDCFPHRGYIWNYGVLPQCPMHIDIPATKNFPERSKTVCVEVLEIGDRVGKVGEIIQIKILGSIALKDDSRFKIIAIDMRAPLAPKLNSLASVMEHFPGLLKASMQWFEVENNVPPEHCGKTADVLESDSVHRILQVLHKNHQENRK